MWCRCGCRGRLSWDVSKDFKQICLLNLRKGVQFHSGRELTSDDVKYNVLRARDPKVGAGQFSKQSNWFSAIDTPDKYTVVLKSDEPRPLVFDYLEYFNIVDKDAMEGPSGKEKLVGTGPFVFVEWLQGDHLGFVKNKNYWQAGGPYLDKVRVNIMRDVQAMVAQFEAGSVNLVRTPPPVDVNQSDLAKIGVKLNVQDLVAAAWADQVNNRKYKGQWWSTISLAQLQPGSMLNGTVTWSPTNDNTGYTSETYARIVAGTAAETDPVKQKQLYSEFNDVLLDDAWIAIVSPAVVSYLAAANVRNLVPNYHNSLTLTGTWLDA